MQVVLMMKCYCFFVAMIDDDLVMNVCVQYDGEMHVYIMVIRYFSIRNGDVYKGDVLYERIH
jgi:hypothetical protein